MKIRYGIIGVGGHGKNRHLIPLIKLKNKVEIVAVADVKKERCEEVSSQFNIKCYLDYMEMVEKESLNAVSIVTPTGLHSRIAINVLNKGVNVLVDKPLGSNLEEVKEVVNTARNKGLKLMVGYWSRFSPALQYGKEIIHNGLLGEPYVAYGYLVRRRGIPGIPTFIDKTLSGGRGALLDIGCYLIDNLLSLLKFRKPISVMGKVYTKFGNVKEEVKFNWGSWDPENFSLDDYAVGLVKLEGDVSLILEVGWSANVSHVEEKSYVRILGDKGGIEGSGHEAIVDISFHSRTENFLTDTKPVLRKVDPYFEMINAFVDSILTDREPPITGEESVTLHSIIDGIYKSSTEDKEVKISL
ncbi:Gfo/Idh/MocA family protein [Saccharolobus solfataricus]|uniref:Dehydrogenase, putative n=3 Tax=Saccharolobus solfataricus TaxID=2287 RepID=Q97UJ6_SACS2|nr:Gfo/Idh/MocA family oxidoreductase [Saccharolobus solfataricus]AET42939.1 dehydrogenase-like protein [Saccharolobus solfataricus 98/2]AAK43117.1 Dehydrogenase, putative [Saccharolobus solfataricus P2]AKA73166.1 gfo/Idh/MocA family oxidoreductase [Saccharolobus solfataricus]AKA75864.1 gfo/Idh/MocA family oxidoreductase [Saccharolobus solfataricus]AKA78556.1 gfo/Idh/MocA family oxidoreductase [Saccharolobus solfataricus]